MATDSREDQNNAYTEVYVWGGDHHGQLGVGKKYVGKSYPNPRVCSFNLIIKEVACGEEHSAFVTMRGHIYTMGSNGEGRLGVGDRAVRQSSTPCLVEALIRLNCIQISCGWGHTVAVMDNGEAYSWGMGEYGALGLGSTDSEWSPAKVMLEEKESVGVSKVSCGSRHTAFISELGTVYICGVGDAGQLGTGKREKEVWPVQLTLISDRVVQVACGIFHTLILTERGKVFATGGNTFGQLGIGNKKNTSVPIKIKELDSFFVTKVACGHHSAALTDTGELYLWGTGAFGEFCSPMRMSQSGARYKEIDIGSFFGAAIDESGLVWVWGSNTSGELGLADYEPRKTPYPNTSLQGKIVTKVACGGSFVIALGNVVYNSKRQISTSPSSLRHDTVTLPNISKTPSVRNTSERSKGFTSVRNREPRSDFGLDQTSKPDYSRDTYASPQSTYPNREHEHTRQLTSPGAQRKSPQRTLDSGPTEHSFQTDPDERLKPSRISEHEHDTQRARPSVMNDTFLDLLLKQKNLLESSLKHEKEDKQRLEETLDQTRAKLKILQERNSEADDIKQTVDQYQFRFTELKKMYEEACKKSDSLADELASEKENNTRLQEKNTELGLQMEQMQRRANELAESLQNKSIEFEDLRMTTRKQTERNKSQMAHDATEIAELQAALSELNNKLEESQEKAARVERMRLKELGDKEMLEKETFDLSRKMNQFMDRLEEAMNALDREQLARSKLEREVEALQKNEQDQLDQNLLLKRELENLRAAIAKNIETEQENNSRMEEENERLKHLLQSRDEEIEGLKQHVQELQDDLADNETKNDRLIRFLNEEVNRQAEEYKQRALGVLLTSSRKSREDNSLGQGDTEGNESREGLEENAPEITEFSNSVKTTQSQGRRTDKLSEDIKRLMREEEQSYRGRADSGYYQNGRQDYRQRDNIYEVAELGISGSEESGIGQNQKKEKEHEYKGGLASRTGNESNLQRDLGRKGTGFSFQDRGGQYIGSDSKGRKLDTVQTPEERDRIGRGLTRSPEEYQHNLSDVREKLSNLQEKKLFLEAKMQDFELRLRNVAKP